MSLVGPNWKILGSRQGPRCAPNTQSRKAQYFRFVRHTFVTNKVIKHEK